MVLLILLLVAAATAQWVPLNRGGPAMYSTEANAMPPARSQPAMWCLNDDVYVYGGEGADGEKLTDLWKFETETNRWFWQPAPPAGVEMSPLTWTANGRLWMNGWTYNPELRAWGNTTRYPYGAPGSAWYYLPTETLYVYAPPRLTAFANGQWTAQAFSGDSPALPGRATVIGDSAFVFERDLYCFDVAASTWTHVNASTFPDGRADVATLIDQRTNTVAIFGGRIGAEIFGDTWTWDDEKSQWMRLSSNGPAPRWGVGSCVNQQSGETFVFGGATDDPSKKYNDLWKFGPLSKQNILDILDFQLNATALSAYIGAVFGVLTFVLIVVSLLVWGICACRRRKQKVMAPLEVRLQRETERAFESAEDF
jgi:hypothetical protein